MSLEINPKHPIYQQGLQTLIAHMWNPAEFVEDDVCVVAMLVSMLVNGRYDPSPIAEMIQGRPGAYQRTSQRGSGVPAEKETAEKRVDGELILTYITQFHLPTRWKYDVLRALVFFASIKYPTILGWKKVWSY